MADSVLTGEVALVTGAGQGIGKAVAERLGSQGAAVLVSDLELAAAEEVALGIAGAGGVARALVLNVRRPGHWARAMDEARAWKGGLSILVNNAGFDRPGAAHKVSLENWAAVLEVHLTGCLLGIQAATVLFKERKQGRVVNVSSLYGKVGGRGEAAYSAAKAGMVGLTKSAARDLARHNVLVNCVLPGLTDTPAIRGMMSDKVLEMILAETPLGRMARPAEIAAVIAFLCGPEASFVTGAAWEVGGGWHM